MQRQPIVLVRVRFNLILGHSFLYFFKKKVDKLTIKRHFLKNFIFY